MFLDICWIEHIDPIDPVAELVGWRALKHHSHFWARTLPWFLPDLEFQLTKDSQRKNPSHTGKRYLLLVGCEPEAEVQHSSGTSGVPLAQSLCTEQLGPERAAVVLRQHGLAAPPAPPAGAEDMCDDLHPANDMWHRIFSLGSARVGSWAISGMAKGTSSHLGQMHSWNPNAEIYNVPPVAPGVIVAVSQHVSWGCRLQMSWGSSKKVVAMLGSMFRIPRHWGDSFHMLRSCWVKELSTVSSQFVNKTADLRHKLPKATLCDRTSCMRTIHGTHEIQSRSKYSTMYWVQYSRCLLLYHVLASERKPDNVFGLGWKCS